MTIQKLQTSQLNLINWIRRCVWFLVAALILGPAVSQADVNEDIAIQEYKFRIETLFKEAESSPKEQTLREVNHIFYETQNRLQRLQTFRADGRNYNEKFYFYLQDELAQKLTTWARARNYQFSESLYREDIQNLEAQIQEKETQLRNLFKELSERHPKLGRIVSLMSFARSETLADGTIGDWNPADAQKIQKTAIEGLESVLDRIESGQDQNKPTLDLLIQYQSIMLGAAGHFFSQPGRINDIVLKGQNGKSRHIKEFLADWQKSLSTAPLGAASAYLSSMSFLHLHPFGDSNGRAAEVLKQMGLNRSFLPPLLTYEKTALENYLYQNLFGLGTYQRSVLGSLQETENFLKSWAQVLGKDGRILGVKLAGNSVVAQVATDQGEKFLISTRSYRISENLPMPPIRGSVVLVETDPSAMKMRASTDHWKSYVNLTPTQIVSTERMGRIQTNYPIFTIQSPRSAHGTFASPSDHVVFAYYYLKASNSSEVWFSNKGHNYSASFDRSFVPNSQAPVCQRAHLSQ